MKVAGEAPTWPFPTLQHLTHSLSDVSFLMELSVLKKLLLVPLSQHAEDNEISGTATLLPLAQGFLLASPPGGFSP